MEIKSYSHKGLKALAASGEPANVRGIPSEFAKKLHYQLTVIQASQSIQDILSMGMWKPHELKPGFPGKWALSVSANYRLTFWLESDGKSVRDVNLEDYH